MARSGRMGQTEIERVPCSDTKLPAGRPRDQRHTSKVRKEVDSNGYHQMFVIRYLGERGY